MFVDSCSRRSTVKGFMSVGQVAVFLLVVGQTVLLNTCHRRRTCVCGLSCCSLVPVTQKVLKETCHCHRTLCKSASLLFSGPGGSDSLVKGMLPS